MIPNLINDTGRWLDRFSEVLERWETLLDQVQADYLIGDYANIQRLSIIGEGIHAEIQACKDNWIPGGRLFGHIGFPTWNSRLIESSN